VNGSSDERREFRRAVATVLEYGTGNLYLYAWHRRNAQFPDKNAVSAGVFMIRKFLLSSIALVLIATPALADSANLLGAFKNWQAYSTGTGSSMTCYAMSAPRATEPRSTKRAPIYLMVSDWPGRKIKAEPEVVPGYAYKLTAPVTLGIGGDKFNFFARNDGQNGTAWLQNLKDGDALMDALNHGVSAVAIGTSARGTKTVDTYSLAGFADAVTKIHAACNMG
jgi:hypothetical protein